MNNQFFIHTESPLYGMGISLEGDSGSKLPKQHWSNTYWKKNISSVKRPLGKVSDEYLDKVKIAFETTQVFSLLGLLDNKKARKWCIHWGSPFTRFVINSVVGTTLGWITGGYIAGVLAPYYPQVTIDGGKIGGAVLGFVMGTYCWQSVEFENTYLAWRQENFNTDVLDLFDEFLKQDKELKPYICPLLNILCICPIKIERKQGEKTETLYYSGLDLENVDYVEMVKQHVGRGLDDNDIMIDIMAYGKIYMRIDELLKEHERLVRADINEGKKEKIILAGLKHIRQTFINFGEKIVDNECNKLLKLVKNKEMTLSEAESRQKILKIVYLKLDNIEVVEVLKLFLEFAKDQLKDFNIEMDISKEERLRRYMEITKAEFNFDNKEIDFTQIRNILLKNFTPKEV